VIQALAILTILLAVALPLILRGRDRQTATEAAIGRVWHLLFLVCTGLMALSSVVVVAVGSSMHGWMLLLHMSIAPVFAIAIMFLSVAWAERVSELLRLVLLSAFVTIVSAMFMMMTWFGTDWQRWLMNVHRVSSMVLVVAAAAQAGRLLLTPRTGAGSADAARTGD
jgi:hypothetical protein